jgi:TATA-box binding protein (TBP) (component of TFIID and TFIIIB)
MMKIVCKILHGQLIAPHGEIISLENLSPFAHVFYQHKPRMLKYHQNEITLLIFTSLRFRLMGKGDAHMQVVEDFLHLLPWNMCVSTRIQVNMTVTHKLEQNVNLHKLLHNNNRFSAELELFPAAKFIHNGSEHVNIFHTGRIVITGVRDINKIQNILLPDLLLCVQDALYS